MAKRVNTIVLRDCEKSWKDAISMTKDYKKEIIKAQKTASSDKKNTLQKFNKFLDESIDVFNNDINLIKFIKNDPEIDNKMINRLDVATIKRKKLIKTIKTEYNKIIKC